MVLERQPVTATDSHAQEGAGAKVETCRPHDDVERPLALGRLDPLRRHAHHRGLLDVDEGDVRLVVGLEVIGDERRPVLTVALVFGDQLLGRLRILDDPTDLLSEELAPLGVGSGVEQQVGVVAGELREPGTSPHRLEERPPLILRVVEGGAVVRGVKEPRS